MVHKIIQLSKINKQQYEYTINNQVTRKYHITDETKYELLKRGKKISRENPRNALFLKRDVAILQRPFFICHQALGGNTSSNTF